MASCMRVAASRGAHTQVARQTSGGGRRARQAYGRVVCAADARRRASGGQRAVARPEQERTAAQAPAARSLSECMFAAGETDSYLSLAAISLGTAALLAASGELPAGAAEAVIGDGASHAAHLAVGDLASDENFLVNLGNYAKFFISLMTGTAYVITKPFVALLKRPTTAVLFVVGAVGFVLFLRFTIDGMLGITEPVDYQFSPIN